jgi:hypothetical protein
MISEIIDQVFLLREQGYFPDTIAFAPYAWRTVAKEESLRSACLFTPGDKLLGMGTKIIFDLNSDFLVYQSRTKTDPEWPDAFLKQLAFRKMVKR